MVPTTHNTNLKRKSHYSQLAGPNLTSRVIVFPVRVFTNICIPRLLYCAPNTRAHVLTARSREIHENVKGGVVSFVARVLNCSSSFIKPLISRPSGQLGPPSLSLNEAVGKAMLSCPLAVNVLKSFEQICYSFLLPRLT